MISYAPVVRKIKTPMSRTRPLQREYNEKRASISESVWNPRHRRLTLGLVLIILGPAFEGPALATIVADLVGWRWVFLGLVPVLPLATVLVLPALKQLAPSTTSGSWDLHRLLAAVGVVIGSGMTLAGLQVQSIPIAIVLTLSGLVVGIFSLHRILPAGTLQAKAGMPAAIATMGFLSMAFFGGDAFLPLTLISIRGQNTIIAGIALTAATITWTTGSWLQAKLAPGQGRRLLVTAGLLL